MISNFKFYATNLAHHKSEPLFDIRPLTNIGNILDMKHRYEFHPSTPSLCLHNGQLINVVRYVNYYIVPEKNNWYYAKDDKNQYITMNSCKTRNVCGIFDIQDDQLVLQNEFEIGYNNKFDNFYTGTEDVRIISKENSIEFTGNKITHYEGKWEELAIHIEYGILDVEKKTY